MRKPYAIFLSLTDNYAHLFNALYNSAELFGIGEYAEFVVIHDGSLPSEYIHFMEEKTKQLKTQVRFVLIQPIPGDEGLGKVMTVKFYRYKIMAELGIDYEAICFMDTDIFFASGIREFFEIAAKTSLFVATNDDVVRNYKCNPAMSSCPAWVDTREPFFKEDVFDGKFICNVPTFVDMRKYSGVFLDVFEHRCKLGMDNTWPFTGDLETMNIIFLKHGVKNNMLILASHLWTGVHYSIYRVSTAVKRWSPSPGTKISDDQYLPKSMFMSETCEHVRSFHGRDWTSDKSEENLKKNNIPKLISQTEGKFEGPDRVKAQQKREGIFDMIQSYFLYLQFHGAINLDDVEKICHCGGGRYEYMKKRQEQLAGTIRTFVE